VVCGVCGGAGVGVWWCVVCSVVCAVWAQVQCVGGTCSGREGVALSLWL
jgi:hypothetical protein